MIDNLLISPLRQNQTGRDFAASHSSVSDGDPDFGFGHSFCQAKLYFEHSLPNANLKEEF